MNDEVDTLFVDQPQADSEVMRGARVVAAVDGSAGSKAALRFALEDAARRSVPVEAVIAYRPPDFRADFTVLGPSDQDHMMRTARTQHEDLARALVGEVTQAMPAPAPEVHVRAVMGTPSAVLIRESEGADLLVLGSRGHGGFHNMLLGSTSMQCTMHATCPVTVVQSPEAHRHRLKLHRERRRDRGPEARARRRGTVEEPSEAGAQS